MDGARTTDIKSLICACTCRSCFVYTLIITLLSMLQVSGFAGWTVDGSDVLRQGATYCDMQHVPRAFRHVWRRAKRGYIIDHHWITMENILETIRKHFGGSIRLR